MSLRSRGLGTIAVAGALLAVALPGLTPAAAESGRLADFAVALSSSAPATPTGMAVHVQFHRADDPSAKPSPLRSAVIALSPGLRFDTTAVPQCTASDAEIRALGSDACPKDTELTVGKLVGTTGFGPPVDPLAGDDHVFNGPDQLIEIITSPGGSSSPAFDRLTIAGSVLTAHPPMLPGAPPEGETSVRSIDFQIPVRSAGGKSLITTAPDCPSGGTWTTNGTFGFADGSSDTVASTTPCDAAVAPQPQLRLSVRPQHVPAGRGVRLRFRVTATKASCVAGATVRLGRLTTRVDPRGRASIATEFHRAALRGARATSPGCLPAEARVRVTAPH
jgi:hypothetical protein